ncbi:DNA polymerase Y family protein [Pulveribacter sp.]|uniref:DNA polymerase Y family protein n=1 Tax=Pulveribacter sp. TaxID=2678893 RepID=UPI00289FF482|nr:DNA polymerase Y family protein [Pulveribacter sp.]
MCWLAWLLPTPEPGLPAGAQAWWALRFTPRAALLEEALVLEVSSTARLWGGMAALRDRLRQAAPEHEGPQLWAEAATAWQALALLRLQCAGRPLPRRLPHDLPVDTLSALRPHAQALAHLGCRTWGALRELPRAGLARRFGQPCLQALDAAWGEADPGWQWLALPEHFALQVELPALAESASALLWTGQRLLDALQGWLQARQQGVLELELAWHHDLRRVDGVVLPPWQALRLRTAEPLQDTAHLRRLLAERLAHQRLAAPVDRLALRSLQTAPLVPASHSLLAPAQGEGAAAGAEPWHQLVERLSARLGAASVQLPVAGDDHRPERMQRWQPALAPSPSSAGRTGQGGGRIARAALWPPWLLRPPRPLAQQGDRPCLRGQALRLLAGPERVESGWWEGAAEQGDGQGLVRRDYFVAHNDAAGWVWIYRDRASGGWFLHGVYA